MYTVYPLALMPTPAAGKNAVLLVLWFGSYYDSWKQAGLVCKNKELANAYDLREMLGRTFFGIVLHRAYHVAVAKQPQQQTPMDLWQVG